MIFWSSPRPPADRRLPHANLSGRGRAALLATAVASVAFCPAADREAAASDTGGSALRAEAPPASSSSLTAAAAGGAAAGAAAAGAGTAAAAGGASLRLPPASPREAYRSRLDDPAVEWETWDHVFWFPSGHRLLAQFQVTDEGPRKRHGLVTGVIVLPDGSAHVIRNSRPRREWQVAGTPEGLRLALHRHHLLLGATRHRVELRNRLGRFEIEAEPVGAPLELAGARDGSSYELTLLAPRLRCHGVVQLPGSAPVELRDGWGVATHASSTLPRQRLMRSAFSFHAFDPPVQWSLFAIAVPHGRAQRSYGWMVSSGADGAVDVLRSFERRWAGAVPDSAAPRYRTPRMLVVRSSEGPIAEARMTLAPLHRIDVLSWIENPIARFFAGRVSHPVQYLFDARYELRTGTAPPKAPVTGRGLASLSILGQPAEEFP